MVNFKYSEDHDMGDMIFRNHIQAGHIKNARIALKKTCDQLIDNKHSIDNISELSEDGGEIYFTKVNRNGEPEYNDDLYSVFGWSFKEFYNFLTYMEPYESNQ